MVTLFNIPVKRILLIALVVLIGCRDSDKNSSLIFEELNESLERCNKALEREISYAIISLEDLAKMPESSEKGASLLTKGQMIKNYSFKVVSFIDSLNSKLKDETNTNKNLVNEGIELYSRLSNYRGEVLSVDDNIRKEFAKSIPIFDSSFKKNYPTKETFADHFFVNKSISFVLASLSKFKNDLLNSDFEMLSYLRNNVCVLAIVYDKTQAIATSNSSVFKKGQEMIIQTGVGTFNRVSNPSFKVNGVDVLPNENGVGEYKMKIMNEPGDYKVHVKIKYTKPDGRESTLEKDLEYSVIE